MYQFIPIKELPQLLESLKVQKTVPPGGSTALVDLVDQSMLTQPSRKERYAVSPTW